MSPKHLALLASIILFLGLAYLTRRWPQGKHATFSQHAAAHKTTMKYYIALFTVVLPLLIVFFYDWFIEAFRLPVWFGWFIISSAITQYACTLVPETGGLKTHYHRIFAGASALCLIPPLLYLTRSGAVSFSGRLVTTGSLVVLVTIIYLVAAGKVRQYLLVLQTGYFAAFFAAILFVTYIN